MKKVHSFIAFALISALCLAAVSALATPSGYEEEPVCTVEEVEEAA
jgi:hypothetical protein